MTSWPYGLDFMFSGFYSVFIFPDDPITVTIQQWKIDLNPQVPLKFVSVSDSWDIPLVIAYTKVFIMKNVDVGKLKK